MKKKLYIITDKEYKDLKLARYEGGYWSDSLDEAGLNAYESVVDSTGSEFLGGVSYFFAGIWSVVPDTLWGDGVEVIFRKESVCNIAKYNGPYTPININCALLTQKIYQYREGLDEYINCDNHDQKQTCKVQAINKMDTIEEGIKSYCSNILENYDYVDGQKGCIDSCLDIKETLNDLKKNTDLYEDLSGSGNNDCGFSQRLGTWIVNIFKWIKYILPVLVIILGILDFIKAMSSNKEDEMKKAQKNFIIRLIAAALVFIIPLILEFVLIKMGFGYDSCGLF